MNVGTYRKRLAARRFRKPEVARWESGAKPWRCSIPCRDRSETELADGNSEASTRKRPASEPIAALGQRPVRCSESTEMARLAGLTIPRPIHSATSTVTAFPTSFQRSRSGAAEVQPAGSPWSSSSTSMVGVTIRGPVRARLRHTAGGLAKEGSGSGLCFR